jgi:hypothetical protein
METGREVDEIRMKLVGGGIPVPENLIDLDQSSVDMPPPPIMLHSSGLSSYWEKASFLLSVTRNSINLAISMCRLATNFTAHQILTLITMKNHCSRTQRLRFSRKPVLGGMFVWPVDSVALLDQRFFWQPGVYSSMPTTQNWTIREAVEPSGGYFSAMPLRIILVGLAIFFIGDLLVWTVTIWLVFGKPAHADPDRFLLWLNLQWLVGGFEDPSHTAGIVAWTVGNLQRNAARGQARGRFFERKDYQSCRSLVETAKTAGKSGKQIERWWSQAWGSPRAWASRATLDNGRTSCGSEIDHALH